MKNIKNTDWRLAFDRGAEIGQRAGKQKMIEEEIMFLEQLNKLVVWHQSRSLLPYDWFDYEGKRINQRLKELKSQVEKTKC